ncbi:MAG: PH domain-containing protein [Gaiellales bacterium]
MTVIFWAIVGLAWLGCGVGVSNGSNAQALGMLAGALVLGAIGLWLRASQPVAYRLEGDALVIQRRRGATRVPGRVQRHVESATLGLRLGTGGLYGYRGRFRLNGRGWARAFVTDTRRAALIDVGGRPTVLSPVDPAALVQEVAHA